MEMKNMPILNYEDLTNLKNEKFKDLIVRKLYTKYEGEMVEIYLKSAAANVNTKNNFIKLCQQKIEILDAIQLYIKKKESQQDLKFRINEINKRKISFQEQKLFINEYELLDIGQKILKTNESLMNVKRLANNLLVEISMRDIHYKKINGRSFLIKFLDGIPLAIQLKELKLNLKKEELFYKNKPIVSLMKCFEIEYIKYKKEQIKRIFGDAKITEEEESLKSYIQQEIMNQLYRNKIILNESELFDMLMKDNVMDGILQSKYEINICEKDGISFHRITPKKSKNKEKDNQNVISKLNNRVFIKTLKREIEITHYLIK
jgi:hypothetical protein